MRSGEIVRRDGREYQSTGDYVKAFKTFWHWHMRVRRKQGEVVPDICGDLDDSRAKAPWVYLTEEDVRTLCRHARFTQRALMLFLFDSGIRSPSELLNVRVNDLSDECATLRIRQETSKTFGRTIHLLLCPSVLREYIRERQLSATDYLFSFTPAVMNRYLRRLAIRVLGEGQTAGGSRYSELTLYDFRHASACYWLPRYKSESALKYRFGWKRTDMIHYYTELLGMRDTITREDLYLGEEKTELDQRLAKTEAEKHILEEELETMRNDMQAILRTVESLSRIVVAGGTPTPASEDRAARPSLP